MGLWTRVRLPPIPFIIVKTVDRIGKSEYIINRLKKINETDEEEEYPVGTFKGSCRRWNCSKGMCGEWTFEDSLKE